MDNKAVLPTTRFLLSFMHFCPAGMLVLLSLAFEGRHPCLLVRGLSGSISGEAANLTRLGAWQASIATSIATSNNMTSPKPTLYLLPLESCLDT